MSKKFESVLEKYDAKGLRRLPTAKEEAIEPDTTLEELLIGPGKMAASTIKNLINKKATSRKFDIPEIGSSIPPPGLDPWKNVGFSKPQKTPKEILAQDEAAAAQSAMYRNLDKSLEKSSRRISGELGADIVDRIQSKENAAGDTYKKGGPVSASRRADGIAQRGKTKGRMC
jgi:hypothetical protein